MINFKTLVLGASLKEDRYSNKAVRKLVNNNIETVAFGLKAGEISGIVDNGKIMPTDLAYPYQSTHLQKDFSLSQYQVGCLIFKLGIRDNPKYHEAIKSGKKSVIHKYSEALYERVKSILERYPSYIDEACKDFQKDQKEKRELKKKK